MISIPKEYGANYERRVCEKEFYRQNYIDITEYFIEDMLDKRKAASL